MRCFKRKIELIFILGLLAGCVFDCNIENIYGATVGYTEHEHTWSGNKKCTACKCTSCNGKGYTLYSVVASSPDWVGADCRDYKFIGCEDCGGSGYNGCYYHEYWTKDTDVLYTTSYDSVYKAGNGNNASGCTTCNGTAVIYKCTKSGCKYSAYGNWKNTSGYSGVCYKTAHTYKVSYNSNGGTGTTMSSSSHTYDTVKNLTANTYTKTGYTFHGWNTKADGSGTSYADKASVKNLTATNGATVTLYAQWKANKIKLTLDKGGGTGGTTNVWYYYGTAKYYSDEACTTQITAITRPVKPGYTLLNFHGDGSSGGTNGENYIAYNGIEFAGDLHTDIYKDATLYAQWILNEYTVSYNANGGSGSMDDSVIAELGGALTSNMYTKKGYTFIGWATALDGEVVYADGETIYPTMDTTLYAVWQINSYKVTYDANGGTSDTSYIMHDYGSNIDLSPTAMKDGYTFIGWSMDASSRMPLNALVMNDGDVVLYAIYTIEVSDIENHDYPDYSETADIDKDEVYLLIQLQEDATREKVYPLIYQYDANRMVYKYKLEETNVSSFAGNKAYYYYVIVRDNAGNEEVLLEGSIGENGEEGYDEPPEPFLPQKYTQTVKHYKYNPRTESTEKWDWFETTTASVLENTFFTPAYMTPPVGYKTDHIDGGGTVTGEKTYHAYYMPKEYMLTFDAQGGTSAIASKKVLFDDYYRELPTAIREGYTFHGWNTKEDGSGTTIKRNDIYTTTTDTTIYAQWTPNVYAVTLDNQGADTAGTMEYYEKYDSGNYTTDACATTISSIIKPEKKGYTFKGYWTQKGGGGDCYIDETGWITSTKITFTEDTILYAYWEINKYTIQYDANSGSGSMSSISTAYDIPVLLSANVFTKEGYTFAGWNTENDGSGTAYAEKEKVEKLVSTNNGSITLYAQWAVNSYKVTYDYATNGGNSVSKEFADVSYGDAIDLTVTANKPDYIFVGWNTDPTAATGITSLTMSTGHVNLYAIFKKTITITLVENGDNGTVTTTLSDTVYNNKEMADFFISEHTTWTGWTNIGWADDTRADAAAITSTGATVTSGSNITLYALYSSFATVSYDTNGSAMEYDSQTKECYYNAYGNRLYPAFVIADAPVLSKYTFVNWEVESGCVLDETGNQIFVVDPMKRVLITENTVLKAVWDKAPVIEAYHRYFTLEEAQSGKITEAELLEKVIARDEEAKTASNPEGILKNGEDVIIKNYNVSDFTEVTGDREFYVTYQATDSFGNIVTKTVTITITDTSMQESKKKAYVRFISSSFLLDDAGNLVSAEMGGLEESSIWRINEVYKELLKETLQNVKSKVEKKTVSAFGQFWEVEVAGSGEWAKKEETWTFTRKDIQEMKNYTSTYGHVLNAVKDFFELFEKCKTEE